MAVLILVGELLLILAITTGLLHKYGDWRRQHVLVSAATLVSWYFSFSIVAILPIDVVQTAYNQCLHDDIGSIPSPVIPSSGEYVKSINRRRDVINESFQPLSLQPTNTSVALPSSVSPNSTTTSPLTTTHAHVTSSCIQPITDVDDEIIKTMWLVVYWSSFLLTWLILPFMQSYSMAGEFTVLGKMKRSLIENGIFYASYLLIILALFVYLLAKGVFSFNKESIKTLVTTASNTWGLFFMVLLMGYGLVEVPRYVWNLSRREHRLRRTYFQVAKLHAEKSDATEALEDVLDNIKDAHSEIPSTSVFHPNLQIIISKSPTNFQDRLMYRPGGGVSSRMRGANAEGHYANEKKLVAVHKRLLVARQNLWRLEAKWEALLKKAFTLEDIVKSKSSGTSEFRRYSQGTSAKRQSICSPRIEFYWKIVIVPKLLQGCGVILAVLSLTLVWSEVTFFKASPVLSFYALFISDVFADSQQYFLIQSMSVFLLLYMCITVYWTVFRVRFFNYYYLSPHHHTDEYTLLFSGMLLCRLTPSICLNFLGVTHMDSHVSNNKDQLPCSFTEVMGHLDIIYFISEGFNIYFPLVLLVLCIMTFFNVGSYVLSFIGFQQFMGDGELTSELVDEGQQLIKREHRRIERENRGEQRRKEWDERLNKSGRGEELGMGVGGLNSELDFEEATRTGLYNSGARSSRPYAEAMRAKYSRNGVGGQPATNTSQFTQSSKVTSPPPNAATGNLSDNSATDLLDDDYVDFQDYTKRFNGVDPVSGVSTKTYGGKNNKNSNNSAIFDDI